MKKLIAPISTITLLCAVLYTGLAFTNKSVLAQITGGVTTSIVNLVTGVTGTLAAANGGTGVTGAVVGTGTQIPLITPVTNYTASANGFTSVGLQTLSGSYHTVGDVTFVDIQFAAATTTASIAGTSKISLPTSPTTGSALCSAGNNNSVLNYGGGYAATSGFVFTPAWTATVNVTNISCIYR